jgi:hypothetical protein
LKTAEQAFTKDSRVLAGHVGQPAKLEKRIALLGDVHFKRKPADVLPASIRGLWKSDLFLGLPFYRECGERWRDGEGRQDPGSTVESFALT